MNEIFDGSNLVKITAEADDIDVGLQIARKLLPDVTSLALFIATDSPTISSRSHLADRDRRGSWQQRKVAREPVAGLRIDCPIPQRN
ncbi:MULTISPECIES: hypothetical protein [Burkholderia]|uniref:hypothetical protein n=1 Tax=unclassified Burkholderia TaxID=2613784 RepID=UPI001177E285|nr:MULTISPECIES: hypothetical protein [unclassified Burkholderia]MBR8234934.1 hypothetical protein [Burkholderia sp. AU32357]MBY4876425.1 hypothetical protein [Burkholderia sp. AU42008]